MCGVGEDIVGTHTGLTGWTGRARGGAAPHPAPRRPARPCAVCNCLVTYIRMHDITKAAQRHHRCIFMRIYICPSCLLGSNLGYTAPVCRTYYQFFFMGVVCQSLFPRSHRLLITIILQDHPGSSRQTLRCFLIVDPRACGCAHNPPWCVSTPSSEKEKHAKGLPSNMRETFIKMHL